MDLTHAGDDRARPNKTQQATSRVVTPRGETKHKARGSRLSVKDVGRTDQMLPHCCFAIVLLLVPFAFLICQAITVLAFDGRWRVWSLSPTLVAALTLALLLGKDLAGPFLAVCVSGVAGLAALALVWAAWRRSARERDATSSV